ncbi:nickel/cobalt efflux protein RcnA, partial [Escherichia coli]|nr:nickel/cobalt efflux protein RcnA [Escherichia coli]
KVSLSSDGYQPADIYHFIERDGYLESASCIEVSNGLSVTLIIGHHDHTHDFDVHFRPGSHLENEDKEYQDAHERAHALDIQKRF